MICLHTVCPSGPLLCMGMTGHLCPSHLTPPTSLPHSFSRGHIPENKELLCLVTKLAHSALQADNGQHFTIGLSQADTQYCCHLYAQYTWLCEPQLNNYVIFIYLQTDVLNATRNSSLLSKPCAVIAILYYYVTRPFILSFPS